MAEVNGKSVDLPGWVYRGGLVALIGVLIYQATEIKTDVQRLNERQVGLQGVIASYGWRLDLHDKNLETHDRRIMGLERISPRSGPNP